MKYQNIFHHLKFFQRFKSQEKFGEKIQCHFYNLSKYTYCKPRRNIYPLVEIIFMKVSHLFNKYLGSKFCVPGTILDTENKSLNITGKSPCPHSVYI